MELNPIIFIITELLRLYGWTVIIYIILNWLVFFGILNGQQPFIRKTLEVLFSLVEPALRKIRRYIPAISGVDLSPIVLFLIINFLNYALIYYSIKWS